MDATTGTAASELEAEVAEQFDVAGYAVAQAFNSAALPPGMPDWLKVAIEARAGELREISQEGSAFDELSAAGAREKRRKEADERVDAQLNIIMKEQQREREEWAQASHTFAGQTMTGTEWREMADELKTGGTGRDWLLAYLIQHGKTEDQAKRVANDMQLAAKGMSKPKTDRTDDEKAAMGRVEADPESKTILRDYAAAKAKDFPPLSPTVSGMTNSGQTASTNEQANALDDGFPTAPKLTALYREANSAIEPLDAPRPAAASVTAPASQPAAAAGLAI